MAGRVILVGLDGASFDIVEEMSSANLLPSLEKLKNSGASGMLTSTLPPNTVPAVDSLITGASPGKLGIFSFLARGTESYRSIPSFFVRNNRDRAIWNVLGSAGLKCCVINVPTNYMDLSHPDTGIFVPGWLGPNTNVEPGTMRDKLEKIAGNGNLDFDSEKSTAGGGRALLADLLHKSDRLGDLVKALILEKWWHFFIVFFTATDRAQHVFWKNGEISGEIAEVYARMDEIIGKIDASLDSDDYLFVLSDHGFGSVNSQFNANKWLEQSDYLVRCQKKALILRNMLKRWGGKLARSQFGKEIAVTLPPGFAKFGDRIARLNPPLEELPIDWSKTRVYCMGEAGTMATFFVNMMGREPEGIVPPGEQETVVETLGAKLNREFGERVRTFRGEEVFGTEGSFPDLIAIFDDYRMAVSSTLGEACVISGTSRNSGHNQQGIIMVRGPGIKEGLRTSESTIMDVVPTIYAILNYPPPKFCTGKILANIFNEKELGRIQRVADERDSIRRLRMEKGPEDK